MITSITPYQQVPVIVHVIYQLGIGGLENGLVNIINAMPVGAYRHVIICLTNSTDFEQRLTRKDVKIYALNKKAGQDWGSFLDMYRLLRQLKPAIVHTRNLNAIEYQISALLAGVKYRIHSEHGWDTFDPDGSNKKYQWVRRCIKPCISHYIALSRQIEEYLITKIKVSPKKITRIGNGVDVEKFYPLVNNTKPPLPGCPYVFTPDEIIIGTVGRMHGVKDQLTLVKAFIHLCKHRPELRNVLKLFLIGDGPLKPTALQLLAEAQLLENAWLPGECSDIPEIMRRLDIFVLPSQAEGISNTILEAMATSLPVIATNVGGNSELIEQGISGMLIPANDPIVLADKILDYVLNKHKRQQHGQQAWQRIKEKFSLVVMVGQYQAVYETLSQSTL